MSLVHTGGDAVFHGPEYRFVAIHILGDIRKGIRALCGSRFAGHPPQEGHDLPPGHVECRHEFGVGHALGDAVFVGPQHSVIEVIFFCHVLKRIEFL